MLSDQEQSKHVEARSARALLLPLAVDGPQASGDTAQVSDRIRRGCQAESAGASVLVFLLLSLLSARPLSHGDH